MGKRKKLCHYVPVPREDAAKKLKEKDSCQLVVNWDVTTLVETIYRDNMRLTEENAVLRERAKPHLDKADAIDAESIEIAEEDTNNA